MYNVKSIYLSIYSSIIYHADIRMNKMIAIAAVSRVLPQDTIMVFVDSMDVRNS